MALNSKICDGFNNLETKNVTTGPTPSLEPRLSDMYRSLTIRHNFESEYIHAIYRNFKRINDGHYESKGISSPIPYNELQDIKVLNEGGFGKIFKATWVNNLGVERKYAEGGSLFDNLSESYKDIPWQKKLTRLQSIIKG
ncbi:28347_t:CDS:2 [Gigaspora margarita]|uniref:28347_t:CDS:1 n=1 Tax=Gigaspora margarita TaxID=4874 RepID=A0ABN7UA67_GIGMA|nr:28347_t:CDS:2 [Gigaspora margarita]